jgi:glucose-6-phosphate isomerase
MHDGVVQDPSESFRRFQAMSSHHAELGFSIDLSRMSFDASAIEGMAPQLASALAAMAELEGGAIANPDEERMVGHYWLRAPELAPRAEIRAAIEEARAAVWQFAEGVLAGSIKPPNNPRFETLVVVGIGGSSLGPLLVYEALRSGDRGLRLHFIDNTDPEGVDQLVSEIDLAATMTVVISKSGGTKETSNGMIEMRRAYE